MFENKIQIKCDDKEKTSNIKHAYVIIVVYAKDFLLNASVAVITRWIVIKQLNVSTSHFLFIFFQCLAIKTLY